ncbi:protein bark beetle [Phlebotomus papatasi]|uniref:protein bark beetle n=1 Tax=Phlebotomus papatasi TaxID=29031 RepID=UPI002483AE40|nr:protein bark beetle [Phlebotomus papatasi]
MEKTVNSMRMLCKRHKRSEIKSIITVCILSVILQCVRGQDVELLNEIDGYTLEPPSTEHHPQSLDHVQETSEFIELPGGSVTAEKILHRAEKPYLLLADLDVETSGRLVIEPGVSLHFAPSVGITVRGVIQAVGSASNRIVFSPRPTYHDTQYDEGTFVTPEDLGARLVDGPTPLEGRLQIFHKGKWRSVCTNSRNWTIPNYEVVCRQMGFKGGRFWNWMDRIQNYQPRLLLEEPECQGSEDSLFKCSWDRRQLGSGVCDYHSDIGIQCLPLHAAESHYWRGIRFEFALSEPQTANNAVFESLSHSELKYVDIKRAGYGPRGSTTSAIEVLGNPPVLHHVTVDHSAFTGINVTRSDAAFTFRDVVVRRSRGIGIFVNSSYGLAHLEGCTVSSSGADGVKYEGHDWRFNERPSQLRIYELCSLPTTAGQIYPIWLSVDQSQFSAVPKECGKYFFTRPGFVLTVSFQQFVLTTNETAQIEVFDGASPNDRLLGMWSVRNYTRPQSLTSTREKIYVRFRAQPRAEMVGYLRLTAGQSKTYDLNVTKSRIEDNGGSGVAVGNLRSQVHIHTTMINNNGHAAGLNVVNGAGDVNVTESRIGFNQGSGINITYFGGNRNISRTYLTGNREYGLAVWLNQTAKDREEFYPFNQTTAVQYSEIFRNIESGIYHGNYSGESWVNITGNWFNDSLSNSVEIQTCWFPDQNGKKLNLQIGQNIFEHDNRIGLLISPALNLNARIEFNEFRKGTFGALLIRNRPLEEFRQLPARIIVQHNQFYKNRGIYVASLGLSPYTTRRIQSILFTRNFIRENKIQEAFGPVEDEGVEGEAGVGRLNPRSRVAAPVVISSSNVDIFRNIFFNPDSKYEVGSQLSDQSEVLNVTFNYLGHTDEARIFAKLFHRYDRYDLAKINYFPYLLHPSNPGTNKISSNPTFVPSFHSETFDKVGGEIDGQITLTSGTYTVEKDINVRPGGKLVIHSGVTLNFVPNVGLMVAGKLEARGRNPDDITFTLKREPIATADNETNEAFTMEAEMMDSETEPNVETTPTVPVRLLGGVDEHEGRLQVYVDGRWGTVCDYGWNIINSALVCHQLGLALNPYDWRLQRSEVPGAGTTEDIVLSHVRCTEHDIDITQCRSERADRGEFENSCTHEYDVGIRCYEGAWAGVRFGVLAERVDLQYVTIEKAGVFDYSTNTFKPALQMDFARHNLENVRIVNNLHDGLGVVYSDIFGGDGINNVKNSEFANNRGNGISLKQLGLRVQSSIIRDNSASGITHDPVLSAVEQREIAGWFHIPTDRNVEPDYNAEESNYRPFMLPDHNESIDLETWQIYHIVTAKHIGDPVERTFNIRCHPGYVIGIQLLNPVQNHSTEDIWFHDAQTPNHRSDIWQVSRDLSVFPVTSSSYGIILHYRSGELGLGGVVITLSTIPAPVQNIRNRIVRGPVPTLYVSRTKIQRNLRGLSATYYNRYLGEKGEHYLRKANESMKIVKSEISHNREEAVFIHAPFWDVHESNISEITIHINSSMIIDNGRGIRQFSKDLRSSNNLFHYVLQDTTVERNSLGGMELSLPFVWQYNENFTHSVYLGNGTWTKNRNFGISIAGHYAEVNITGNTFAENTCLPGLIGFRGMEKKLKIDNNRIIDNNGKFMVEFKADSQSEILGTVHAVFVYNDIRNNRFEAPGLTRGLSMALKGRQQRRSDPTTVIGFGGIQKVMIRRNLITGNRMDYDLVAGVISARLSNFLDATENWWGSIEVDHIYTRIFDFDDWNNHAEVIFRPFLLEDNVDASMSVSFDERKSVDLDNLGGRIFEDLSLFRREVPYVIKSDITVMPGVTLSIGTGVEMEFAPNVGILVLGTLQAMGSSNGEIIMRPIARQTAELNRVERSLENLVVHDSIRLCTNRNCSYEDNEIDPTHQGFLEYFNHTTLQWVPICDRRFTERNAQVVCRELGFDPLNVFFAHDRRIEFHTNSLTRIWSWVEPLECEGDENRMEECPERLNGQLYGRRHECQWDSEFVFVSCQGDPDKKDYWGGIRFANPDFESDLFEHRLHDSRINGRPSESTLEQVRIESAGILHGEKSPAIQSIFKNPRISSVTVKNSAHHALNLISPTASVHVQFLRVFGTLGQGINAISLTGEGRESDESSFTPLRSLDLPYSLFSLIDICDTEKEITIEERVIVYYKYDNNPVNCVKIFNSAYRVKPLGFRLLQSNLFNHSREYGRRDGIHLFDGDIYNVTARKIGVIEADSGNDKYLFRTTMPSLSVRLVASGAPADHGFFAEIVTLPISAIGFNRDSQHNISNSEISGAIRGAVSYSTAGEVSPTLTLEHNRFMRNCIQLYGNFSTCESTIRLDVQNMQSLFFRNNLVQWNQGGLSIRSDSRGSATSLRGWVHHNLFTGNRNRPSLCVEGRQSSPYQEITVFKNYFTQNLAAYEDVIALKQVVSNFSNNYVHRNRGGRIVEISGFDKVRLPIYQTTAHNGFYHNVATDWRGRATIVAGTAGQNYVDNIFYNPDNDYEMITVNRSIFDFQFWNSTLDVWKTKIDARHNYWNYNTTLAVSGRIRDRADDPILLEVQFLPFYMNNETILDGKCPPGWTLIVDTCYIFVGAPMTFYEARDFCRSDNASMPFIRGDTSPLWHFLSRQMMHFSRGIERVWVQDLNFIDQCTTFFFRNIELDSCDSRRTFVCEIDPKVMIDPLSWRADIVTISMIAGLCLLFLLLVLVLICWYSKSRVRHVQRLQRRNSIRQSLRSLNSIDPQGSMRRRNMHMSRSNDILSTTTGTDYKKMPSNGSIDSIEKSALSSETSYDMYDQQNGASSEYSARKGPNSYGNDFLANKYGEYANQKAQRNEIPKTPKVYGLPQYEPQGFELAYRNEGFRDNSTFSGTRQNSISTTINEDTPIIQQVDPDEAGSDYYGNSSTLPLRHRDENLSFLSELKTRLPDYEPLPRQSPSHSSFLPSPPSPPTQSQKTFAPAASDGYHRPQIRRPDFTVPPPEIKRPESYYTAMRTARDSQVPPQALPTNRPRTVYEPSGDERVPSKTYSRSKSEALLETNFDEESTSPTLKPDNRSYSQPLETAM